MDALDPFIHIDCQVDFLSDEPLHESFHFLDKLNFFIELAVALFYLSREPLIGIGYIADLDGIFVFNFTQRAFITTSRVMPDSLPLIRALPFPRACLPIGYVLIELEQLGMALVVLTAIVLGTGEPLTWYWLPPARWEGFSAHLVLPVLTLSAVYMAYIARLTRSGMLEVLRSNYIRTARAKGLSDRDVIIRHALRGGLLPVVSFSGPALAFLISGTVVVERIFALPGVGNYFIQANLNRDEPLILGIVVFISIVVLFFNLLVDVAYGFIDPRVRF